MCINLSFITKNKTVIDARTQELTARYKSEFIAIAPNYEYDAIRSFENGVKATTKYAILGQNAIGLVTESDMVVDGFNEKGLSGQTLYFAQNAKYPSKDKNDVSENDIEYVNILNFILGNFATCQEIRDYFYNVSDVCLVAFNDYDRDPGHYQFCDATGDNVVIEPEDGKFNVKENPLRVFTNSPSLEYHYDNLKNYANLSYIDPITSSSLIDQVNQSVTPAWMGTAAFGLPGDYTSPSRFVRAAFLLRNSIIPDTANAGVNHAFHILHTSDLVMGVSRRPIIADIPNTQSEPLFDENNNSICITDHIIVKDLTNLCTYYKSYDNLSIRRINFNDIDFSKAMIQYLELDNDGSLDYQEINF